MMHVGESGTSSIGLLSSSFICLLLHKSNSQLLCVYNPKQTKQQELCVPCWVSLLSVCSLSA